MATQLAVAHFNDDGATDFADIAFLRNDNVRVILTGPGTDVSSSVVDYTVGEYGYSLATADVTGDGNVDLVVSGFARTVFLAGQGDGTFTPGSLLNPPPVLFSFSANVMHFADINYDGLVDFVAQDRRTPDATHYALGLVTGGFAPAETLTTTRSDDVVMQDLTEDSIADAVFTGVPTPGLGDPFPMSVAFGSDVNNGVSRLGSHEALRGQAAVGLLLADFNGDDKLDIATTQPPSQGCVDIYLSPRDPGVSTTALLPGTNRVVAGPAKNIAPRSAALADFNADGVPDVAAVLGATSVGGTLVIYEAESSLGMGSGALREASPPLAVAAGRTLNNNKNALLASDCNGDGRTDLLLATQGGLVVLQSGGFGPVSDGTFSESLVALPTFTDFSAPWILADVRLGKGAVGSDGMPDVVFAAGTNLGIAPGLPNCAFGAVQTVATGVTLSGSAGDAPLQAADFNSDGVMDLGFRRLNDVAVLFSGAGAPYAVASNITPIGFVVGDTDNDGDADILERNTMSIAVSSSNGLASTFTALPSATNISADPQGTGVLSDVNGDGVLDLLTLGGNAISPVSGVSVTMGLVSGGVGANGFVNASQVVLSFNSVGGYVADLNVDGTPDVFGWNSGAGKMGSFFLQGGSSSATSVAATTNPLFASAPRVALSRAFSGGPTTTDRLGLGTTRGLGALPPHHAPLTRAFFLRGAERLVRRSANDAMGPRLVIEKVFGDPISGRGCHSLVHSPINSACWSTCQSSTHAATQRCAPCPTPTPTFACGS